MPKIFLSHASADQPRLQTQIIDPLTANGISVWYSREDIQPGVKWQQSIRAGMSTCDYLLLACSNQSVTSDFVHAEVNLAFDAKKPIVVVRFDDSDPQECDMRLSLIQHVDFRNDQATALRKLISILNGKAPVGIVRDPKRPAWLTAVVVLIVAAAGATAAYLMVDGGSKSPPAPPADPHIAGQTPPPVGSAASLESVRDAIPLAQLTTRKVGEGIIIIDGSVASDDELAKVRELLHRMRLDGVTQCDVVVSPESVERHIKQALTNAGAQGVDVRVEREFSRGAAKRIAVRFESASISKPAAREVAERFVMNKDLILTQPY